MIWTLGDFNSVYLLTGGGPADLTHVLATLGIRYLRLDQVDLAMASIVVALPLVLPLVYFMMKRLSQMNRGRPSAAEAQAAADRHPGVAVDADSGLPPVPVRDLRARLGHLGAAVAEEPDAAELRDRVPQKHFYLEPLLAAARQLADDRAGGRRDHAGRRHLRGLRDQPAQGARRAHGDEHGAVHLLHPGRLPGRADVQDDGQLRPAQQPLVADPGDGDDRVAVLHLGAQAGLRQAAVGARRGGAHRRRHAAAAVPPGLPAADGAVAGGGGHLCAAAGLERIPLRLPAAVATRPTSRWRSRWATSCRPTIRRGSC